jgi:hypothetical protein
MEARTVLYAVKTINWKAFFLLWLGGLLGVVSALPYLFDLLGRSTIGQAAVPEVPLSVLVLLALLQNGVLLAIVILIGMILSKRINLRMPLVQACTTGEPLPDLKGVLSPSLFVGIGVGVVLVAVEVFVFLPHLPEALHPFFQIPLWKRLPAGILYGGITEELLMRLFLLSLVAWLLSRRWRTPKGLPTSGVFWAAIFVAAILFGLGHLPATSAIVPLTQGLIVRALLMNAVAGIAFGYLYWKHGLEAAMVGHMAAHLVIQIPGMILVRGML